MTGFWGKCGKVKTYRIRVKIRVKKSKPRLSTGF
jgi:hypothetical protein